MSKSLKSRIWNQIVGDQIEKIENNMKISDHIKNQVKNMVTNDVLNQIWKRVFNQIYEIDEI